MTTIRLKQELHSVAHALWSCLASSWAASAARSTRSYRLTGGSPRPSAGSLSAGVAALGSMGLVGALAWFSRAWGDPERGLVSYFVVYGFAAAGILYLLQLWIKGTL